MSDRPQVPAKSLGRPVGDGGLLIEKDGLVVYLDPKGLPEGLPPADVVCLSSADPKAVSEEGVLAVAGASTIVAGLAPCVSRFRLNQLPILHGQTRPALGVELTVTGEEGGRVRWLLRWPDCDAVHP